MSADLLSRVSGTIPYIVFALIVISGLLQLSKFLIDRRLSAERERVIAERFHAVEDRPDFHQEMWSMVTGISSATFKRYHLALDDYDAKRFDEAYRTIAEVVAEHESSKESAVGGVDLRQRAEKVAEFYELLAKCASRLGKHEEAYAAAHKSLAAQKTHYTLYMVATAAYNVRRYQEALKCIEEAIASRPKDAKPEVLVYEKLRDRAKAHVASSGQPDAGKNG
jgi:tetratricopeptide (TPR) repeat protein